MTQFKTILMTAALLAAPSFALAQVSTDAVKDKAVDTVMDNMTTDDAIVAGKTVLKGGSKEDAAVAVVKNRANKKIEAITGGASMDDLSVDGAMDAGKEMAMDKAMGKTGVTTMGSSTTYTDGVSATDVSAAGGLEAGKAMAMEQAKAKAKSMSIEKAKTNAETWGMSDSEKAKMKITGGEPYVIQKSGAPTTTMSAPAAAPAVSTLNCPSGTKDAGDGTCMITGDWKP